MYVLASTWQLMAERGETQTKTANTGIGAAFGTAKSGIGISGVGTFRPDLIMKVRITEEATKVHTEC